MYACLCFILTRWRPAYWNLPFSPDLCVYICMRACASYLRCERTYRPLLMCVCMNVCMRACALTYDVKACVLKSTYMPLSLNRSSLAYTRSLGMLSICAMGRIMCEKPPEIKYTCTPLQKGKKKWICERSECDVCVYVLVIFQSVCIYHVYLPVSGDFCFFVTSYFFFGKCIGPKSSIQHA